MSQYPEYYYTYSPQQYQVTTGSGCGGHCYGGRHAGGHGSLGFFDS